MWSAETAVEAPTGRTAVAGLSAPPIQTGDALFLDIDGTLIELAQTPDAVVIPGYLPDMLRHVQGKLNGALAILSGRKLLDIDNMLRPGLACAAEHGMKLRGPDGQVENLVQRPAQYEHWLKIFNRYAEAIPGLLVEEKEFSLVLHYRRAPEHEQELRALAERLVAEVDDAVLLPAHFAFELKPRGGSKAQALAAFMARAPFAGRRPVFVGDDVTDEPAMAAAEAMGGLGLHVARHFAGTPEDVRQWLRNFADS